MSKFDHRFWEINVDPSVLESVLIEPDFLQKLLDPSTNENELTLQHDENQVLLESVKDIISNKLTDKQRTIVDLYFFKNMTQQEIAEYLKVPQQVVSKHLFGVIRNGQKIGGAITKIRKHCNKLGIEPKSGCKKEY